MQPSSPPRLQRYLSSGMLALCFLLGGAFFTPTNTKAATLYTDFATWAADAGTITNTWQFDWYEYGAHNYPGLTFTLEGGTTWEFTDSTPRSLFPGEPHNGFGHYLWGGNPDAHVFGSAPLIPNPFTPPPVQTVQLSNNTVAGGFWIAVQQGSDLSFTFTGIGDPLLVANNTTQFIGWVGQDMAAMKIAAVSGDFSGHFYIGDFFEGTGPTPIPEPAPLLLLALGCLALLATRRTPWVGKIRTT